MRDGEICVAVAPEWFDDGTNSVTLESDSGMMVFESNCGQLNALQSWKQRRGEGMSKGEKKEKERRKNLERRDRNGGIEGLIKTNGQCS